MNAVNPTLQTNLTLIGSADNPLAAAQKAWRGEPLNDEERIIYRLLTSNMMLGLSSVFQSPSSKERDLVLERYHDTLKRLWKNPNFMSVYEDLKGDYSPELTAFMESFRED